MKVVFSVRFIRDLEAIQDYVAEGNPPAAYRLAQTIRQQVQHLGMHPNMGRPGRIAGTRELVIPGAPDIVYYRVAGWAVRILGVYHDARGPRADYSRLPSSRTKRIPPPQLVRAEPAPFGRHPVAQRTLQGAGCIVGGARPTLCCCAWRA